MEKLHLTMPGANVAFPVEERSMGLSCFRIYVNCSEVSKQMTKSLVKH